jgi:hypothetical protein
MILLAAVLLVPVAGGEVVRWFRRQKSGRLRWLSLVATAAVDDGRILWVEHASPRGQQTQVLLLDPDSGQETSPRSLWGQWPSRIYVCVTTGRRVLASALAGDPLAYRRLTKYEVLQLNTDAI